ncbi:MAG: NYN domain-containing protein [Candidatus Saccharibacteria bacterium]
MGKTILYIDGENFLFKVADLLRNDGKIRQKSEIIKFKFSMICKSALSDFSVSSCKFYAAKVHLQDTNNIDMPSSVKPLDIETLKIKSELIIESQRRLKRSLMNDKVEFIMSGNVRLQEIIPSVGKKPAKFIFKEKGTDVQLAVDIMSDVCDGKVSTILLLSSDSDMHPIVREAKRRGCKVVYVGFENVPNVGLSNNCNQTVLLRKKEIIDAWIG